MGSGTSTEEGDGLTDAAQSEGSAVPPEAYMAPDREREAVAPNSAAPATTGLPESGGGVLATRDEPPALSTAALPTLASSDPHVPVADELTPGKAAIAIEAVEEARVGQQVKRGGLLLPGMATSRATRTQAPVLRSGGRHDDLLQPGRSEELCWKLAQIFRQDPPSDSGPTNGRTAGLACAYGESYAAEAFSPTAVVEHLQLANTFWDPSPAGNVLRLTVPEEGRLLIVGDTHGQLEDVLWIFFKYGLPSATNQYLFNGDIVDRGGHALEILLLLFALKRDSPGTVHILRGNHEDSSCVIQFGFRSELEHKFQDALSAVWNACVSVAFPLMPIAAIVSDAVGQRRLGVVHGGVPVGLAGLTGPASLDRNLSRIKRQRTSVQGAAASDPDGQLLYNFLWADPAESVSEQASACSRANKFLEADTRAFCEGNGLALLVRSHEVPRTLRGVLASHSGLCFTVFSASNYMGSVGNRGGVLLCSGAPLRLAASEHVAPPWQVLARLLGPGGVAEAEADRRQTAVSEWEHPAGVCGEEFTLDDDGLRALRLPAVLSGASPAAAAQWMQFMAERLVEHKDELFERFCSSDADNRGLLSREQWAADMLSALGPHCAGSLTMPVLAELARSWRLPDPVEYVRFLHRFQIRDDPGGGSVLVDRIQVVSQLQAQLVDFSALNLDRLLDPNGDKDVSRQEFAAFLPRFHIKVPPWQAAALYETMSSIADQNPLTLDSTILCLALASQDPPASSEWADMAEAVGHEVHSSGMTLPGAFRSWDSDSDGFLSLGELEAGLKSLPVTREISHEQAQACCAKISHMGAAAERVSVFEFVRALAPRAVTLALQQSMIKEVLKRVWVCRPMLLSSLAAQDPDATNVMDLEVFRQCLKDINGELEVRGLSGLSDVQICVIGEIAAAGDQKVRYDHFVRGLHVEDVMAAAPTSKPVPKITLTLPGLGFRRNGI